MKLNQFNDTPRYMGENYSKNLMVNVALALFAGVLGSLLTLLVTSKLTMPVPREPATQTVVQPSGGNQAIATDFIPALTGNQTNNNQPGQENDHENLRDALARASAEASAERAQLASVLAQLTRQIETLEAESINRQAREALDDVSELADHAQQAVSESGNFGQTQSAGERIDSLVAAGVDNQQAQDLQARQDQYQLARLELFDQAERENWLDSEQFSERLSELDEMRPDLRTELGDDQYDRYLFESGRSNRVVIESVIPGSTAEGVGLQAGDMFVSYADNRVFSTSDLQRATREGQRGEPVALNVERQGQSLFFEVQRGPLGISLNTEQQSPS